jgi:transcriptional regulator of acetoin/glycerol metabolism
VLKKYKVRWQEYMDTGELSENMRPEIVESWHRCEAMKVDHLGGRGTKVSEEESVRSIAKKKELIEVSRPIMENVFEMVKNTSYSVVLTDEQGVIIDLIINKDLEEKHVLLNFVKGSKWDEQSVGTNAIGTCLAIDKPIQVIGAEHFCEYHHKWTCSAAPIHNNRGEIIGCFDLSGRAEDVQTHTYGIAVSSANCIEKQLMISESFEFLNTTMNSIIEGIMVIDYDLKVIKVNDKLLDMFRMNEDTIYNIDIKKIFDGINIEDIVLNDKQKMDFSDTTISIDNRKIECSLHISPIIINGEVAGLVMLMKEAKQVRKEVSKLAGFNANYTFDSIITGDVRMKELINTAIKISKTNCAVLIEGESGTGKELYAQSIHNESHRKNGPFIAINCSAIPKELFESELFGYESGSFTGAVKGGRPGKFELANGGTIFLDEIGEIPLEVQPKLLRVLDNNKVVRIGGTYERELDVRIISATNRDLIDEVSKGSFRQDLYFRLNVINLKIPPLRKRKNDIIQLAMYFLNSLNEESNIRKSFTKEFEEYLLAQEWSGNVRELKNIVQRAYYMSDRDLIDTVPNSPVSELSFTEERKIPVSTVKPLSFKDIEKNSIIRALSVNKGNVIKAAEDLHISKATIYRKIKTYSIDLK